MAKDKSFAAKVKRAATGEVYATCKVCKEQYAMIQVVKSVPAGKGGAQRFMEKVVKVCKCNQKTLYDI
ncbi:hypothetical protein L0128_04495 [candidate division KSB1 bacterium]|nr:hypothetical protein [candidate division KSB1 bacterium]